MSNAQKLLGFAVAMLLLAGGGYIAIAWLEQPPDRSNSPDVKNASPANVEEKDAEAPLKPDPMAEKAREQQLHLSKLLSRTLKYYRHNPGISGLAERDGETFWAEEGNFRKCWILGGRRTRYSGSLTVIGLGHQPRDQVIAIALRDLAAIQGKWKEVYTANYPLEMFEAGLKELSVLAASEMQFDNDGVQTNLPERRIAGGYTWSLIVTDGRKARIDDGALGVIDEPDPAVEKWEVRVQWSLPRHESKK